MRPRAVLSGVLVAGTLACGGAGCGGGSVPVDPAAASSYVARVDRVERGLARAFSRVQDGLGTTATPRQQVAALSSFETATAAAARALTTIRPPAAVTGEHRVLTAAVAGYGRAIDGARGALAARPDAQGAFAAGAELEQAAGAAQARIEAARRAIDAGLTA